MIWLMVGKGIAGFPISVFDFSVSDHKLSGGNKIYTLLCIFFLISLISLICSLTKLIAKGMKTICNLLKLF